MPGRFIGIRVPRGAVALLLGRLDETPLSLVPPRTEALNLLVTYASALAETLPLTTPELQRLAAGHMHDLVAATIRATRDGRAIAEGRGQSVAPRAPGRSCCISGCGHHRQLSSCCLRRLEERYS